MKHSRAYTILFMMLLAAFFGAAVTALNNLSKATVKRNEALASQRALLTAFDLGKDLTQTPASEISARVKACIDETEQRRDPETGWTFSLIKAYASGDRQVLKGYGFRFRGLGFWAPIEGILALTPDLSKTLGIVILKQTETPGLGGRIAEPVFTDQFREGIRVNTPTPDNKWITISSTPPPDNTPAAACHADAITGATQTCMAMDRILNDHLSRFRRAMATDTKDPEVKP